MTSLDPTPIDPTPLPAELNRRDGQAVLRLERRFPHPPAAVWACLTDPAQLTAWAPFTADRHLGSVGPARLTSIDSELRVEVDGEVLVAEPPLRLVHRWGPDTTLRWGLVATDDGTRLTLEQTWTEASQPDKRGAELAAGWHLCLAAADGALAGTPFGPVVGQAAHRYGWSALRDHYADLLSGE